MEVHLQFHVETRNIRAIVLRAPTWFGPGVRNPFMVDQFRSALQGATLGWPLRTDVGHEFCFVEDAARLAILALQNPSEAL